MPITIEYQPSLIAAGQLAYDAGRGQYLQERDRFQLQSASLGEQARQFDQRLQFAAQESALRDRQFRDQLGMQGYQFNVQAAQRQQGMYADLMRQQMVQEGYAQHAQTQYDIALMREDARAAEQQMVMQRQQALSEQQALQKYIQDNRGVLTPQQVTDLQAQFEQRHGLPFGFDASAAIEAQRAVEETALARRAGALSEMYGIPAGAAEEMLYVDPKTGSVELTSYGQETIRFRQAEMDNKRMLDIAQENAMVAREKMALEERQLGAKAAEDAAKEQEKLRTDQAKSMDTMQKFVATTFASSAQELAKVRKFRDEEAAKASEGSGFEAAYTPKQPDLKAYNWPSVWSEEQVASLLPGTIVWYKGEVRVKDADGKLYKAAL